MHELTATYSPEDNKLRLYATSRLDSATYERVTAAGFRWAPKQDLFVAPMWTPAREDLLLELCGAIDEEGSSIEQRAADRAERLAGLSDSCEAKANAAHAASNAIAERFWGGQPILVGHHSEGRMRRDQDRMHGHMSKAINLWERSEYWEQRAKASVAHAARKDSPAVRARRIKGLEAELRKCERTLSEHLAAKAAWEACSAIPEPSEREAAARAASLNRANGFNLPRKEGDRPDFDIPPSVYDALHGTHPALYAPRSVDEVLSHAAEVFPSWIERAARWVAHYQNRIAYERATLAAQGGTVADRSPLEPGGAIQCLWSPGRDGWAYIQKVNKVSVTILHKYNEDGRTFKHNQPLDKINAVMTRAEVEKARAEGLVQEVDERGFYLSKETLAA